MQDNSMPVFVLTTQEQLSQLIENAVTSALQKLNLSTPEDVFIDTAEACKLCHVSTTTMQSWRDAGIIPFIKQNGKVLYNKADVLAYMKSRTIGK